MANFDDLMIKVLQNDLQQENYQKLLNLLITSADSTVFKALVDGSTEAQLHKFVAYFAPENSEEVLSDDYFHICGEILPLAYARQFYGLCGFIYGTGYDSLSDPLCESAHPLVFAAKENNKTFAEAYVAQQQLFDTLTYDGCRQCPDGVYRTLLEEVVECDRVDIMALYLENQASPNAFCFDGRRLLDAATSDAMRELLISHFADNATEQERNLVRLVYQLKYGCPKRDAINAFFSTEPLLKLYWNNGFTTDSEYQLADILFEAAGACHAELLSELYPYVKDTLTEKMRRRLLLTVLDQDQFFSVRDIVHERPVDIPNSLEALYNAGFRYPTEPVEDEKHPLLNMFNGLCTLFSFYDWVSNRTQWRTFSALWQIGGAPKEFLMFHNLRQIAKEHPQCQLNAAIPHLQALSRKH